MVVTGVVVVVESVVSDSDVHTHTRTHARTHACTHAHTHKQVNPCQLAPANRRTGGFCWSKAFTAYMPLMPLFQTVQTKTETKMLAWRPADPEILACKSKWTPNIWPINAAFLGAVGASAPIEISSVGAAHPKNWPTSNSHKLVLR